MQSYDFALDLSKKASTHRIQFDLVPASSRVLDVGCHTGVLGEALRRQKQCRVAGIDLNPDALEQAAMRLDETLRLDIEQNGWARNPALLGRTFDVILFGDVLEHTRDPLSILREAKELLANRGIVIVSLPNIANLRIRIGLMMGRFDYAEAGILDRTHLRFFTEKSARALVEDAGYSIQSQSVSGYALPHWLIRMFPRLLAVNVVLTATLRV